MLSWAICSWSALCWLLWDNSYEAAPSTRWGSRSPCFCLSLDSLGAVLLHTHRALGRHGHSSFRLARYEEIEITKEEGTKIHYSSGPRGAAHSESEPWASAGSYFYTVYQAGHHLLWARGTLYIWERKQCQLGSLCLWHILCTEAGGTLQTWTDLGSDTFWTQKFFWNMFVKRQNDRDNLKNMYIKVFFFPSYSEL